MDVLRHRVTVTYEAEAEGITSESSSRESSKNCPFLDEVRSY